MPSDKTTQPRKKMKRTILKKFTALLVAAGMAAGAAHASEDSALLDVLQKKGILTAKEAADLKAEAAREAAQQAAALDSASKIKLSAPIQEMRIYGDGRVRYALNEGRVAEGTDHGEVDRFRYKFRLGLDVKMSDAWFFGLQLQAGANARSANITMGTVPVFSKGGVVTGSFVTAVDPKTVKATTAAAVTKVNFGDDVFVGQLYLKYSPWSWLAVEGGRIPPPFVGGNTGASGGSLLVWDPDINPQGFAEHLKYTFGPWGHVSGAVNYTKDGKAVAAPAPAGGMTVDVFANFGQFVYEDVTENNFNKAPGPAGEVPNKADLWMLGFQLGAKANFTKSTYLQLAPALYTYTGGGDTLHTPSSVLAPGVFNGDATQVVVNNKAIPGLLTFNQTAVNDLAVLEIPVEFGWTMWHTPFKIFGEYDNNLEGGQRAAKAGHPDKHEDTAYAVGGSIGQIKKKGDWELKAWWQHVEQFSLDPNIIDDDNFEGHLNMQGYAIRASYAFTDAAWLSILYVKGTRIDHNLGTGGGGGVLGAVGFPLDQAQLLFVDFNLKF
jgi:putative porin